MLARIVLPLIAPFAYWIAHFLFRNVRLKEGRLLRFVLGCYRLAADVGYRRALSEYGHLLFLRGDTVQSRIQGGIYLQRAADAGDARALFQMGRIYEQGFEFHFRADPEKARSYYETAAAKGHPLAVQWVENHASQGSAQSGPGDNQR